jgi:CPA1 family monovalent cation:H+ antiporter
MRGVVTLAVALSAPATLPGRDFMLVTAFAVILVTVLLQGTTLGFVIRALKPRDSGSHAAPLGMAQAEARMAQAQATLVESRAYAPDGTLLHPRLLERYRLRAAMSQNYMQNEAEHQPVLQAHYDLVLEAIAAARAELLQLHYSGQIDNHVLHELERDLDLEELTATSAKAT